MFKQVSLQRTNSTPIEQVDSVNRLAISHKVCTAHKQNLKQNFNDWSDNLYKQDNATAGTGEYPVLSGNIPSLDGNYATNVAVDITCSNEPNKRHLTTTAQDFELYLSDLLSFVKLNPFWLSKIWES